MRLWITICVLIAGLYWVDQSYYSGELTHHADMMLREIIRSYR
jgi:hypothetical protein